MSNTNHFEILAINSSHFTVRFEGKTVQGSYFVSKDFIDIHLPEGNFRIQNSSSKKRKSNKEHPEGELTAPMPGKIVKIFVKEKDPIKKGDLLLVLEAMKMEHKILAPTEGKIEKIFFSEGDRVSQGDELIEVK